MNESMSISKRSTSITTCSLKRGPTANHILSNFGPFYVVSLEPHSITKGTTILTNAAVSATCGNEPVQADDPLQLLHSILSFFVYSHKKGCDVNRASHMVIGIIH